MESRDIAVLYRTWYNKMAEIHFLRDEQGDKQVFDHLNHLIKLAEAGDSDMARMIGRIFRTLKFIERYGIPDALSTMLTDQDDDGVIFTISKPVRKLRTCPLYELRVNWQGIGAYRAIFFVYKHNRRQHLIFTRSVIKQEKSSADFEKAIQETLQILPDFFSNPRKYISF